MPTTFRDIAYDWLASKRGAVRETSFSAYSCSLTGSILPILGDRTEVTERDLTEMMSAMAEAGTPKNSIRSYTQIVKNILKHGAQKGLCEYPTWISSLDGQKKTKSESMVILDPDQERRLARYLMQNPSPRNTSFLLTLVAGLKFGEACALKWGALNLGRRYISVLDSKNQFYLPESGEDKGKMALADDTTVKPRRIPLPASVCEYLKPLAKGKDKGAYVTTGTSVFINRPRTLRDALKQVCRALDLPPVSFQDLRHTFAVRCIESGCDLVTLMSLLGVTDPGLIYRTYGEYFKPRAQEAMEARVEHIRLHLRPENPSLGA